MRKKRFLMALLFGALCLAVFGQEEEETTSGVALNKAGDNWFITVQGGGIWNGGSHWTGSMQKKYGYNMVPGVNFSGIGGVTFGKWLTPNVALGLGLDVMGIANTDSLNAACSFYPHANVYWDLTNQASGYRPDRMYHAIPYVHVGCLAGKKFGTEFAVGLGFLNQFCVNEHWAINIDLRGTLVNGEQLGYKDGYGGTLDLQVGFTYKFNRVGWSSSTHKPCPKVEDHAAELADLQAAYDRVSARNAELEQQNKQLQKDNQELKRQPDPEPVATATPETVSAEQAKKLINQRMSEFAQALHFEYGVETAATSEDIDRIINELKQYLNEYKGTYSGIRITGHTDNVGSAESNMRFGMRRAKYAQQLLEQKGIDGQLLQIESKGLTEPIADNASPEGRAKNRRVEIIVY